jgi:hypothetical protein
MGVRGIFYIKYFIEKCGYTAAAEDNADHNEQQIYHQRPGNSLNQQILDNLFRVIINRIKNNAGKRQINEKQQNWMAKVFTGAQHFCFQ